MDRRTRPNLDRPQLTASDVAGMLEIRAHWPEMTEDDVRERAIDAARHRLAGLVCRPEHVSVAAEPLRELPVDVVTAVDFHYRHEPLGSPEALAEETRRLAGLGATSLALILTVERLVVDAGRSAGRALSAVTAAAKECGAESRTLIATKEMDLGEALDAARISRDHGAELVQAGSWEGPRANFAHLRQLRVVLGPDIQLKWTTPVRNLDVLLLALAEGADRFNGDVEAILGEAKGRSAWMPITVPVRGWDY
jgi:deoxyribose-phosphate aldolase